MYHPVHLGALDGGWGRSSGRPRANGLALASLPLGSHVLQNRTRPSPGDEGPEGRLRKSQRRLPGSRSSPVRLSVQEEANVPSAFLRRAERHRSKPRNDTVCSRARDETGLRRQKPRLPGSAAARGGSHRPHDPPGLQSRLPPPRAPQPEININRRCSRIASLVSPGSSTS